MKGSRKTIADYELLKLYPRHRWKIQGTINNAKVTLPETYVTQFKEWLGSVQKDVLKANVDLQWFLRVEKKERRWHLHFIMGDHHLKKELEADSSALLLRSKMSVRWPVKANVEIEEYVKDHHTKGKWEEYICKADEQDELETHTRWSKELKKEVKRIARRKEETKVGKALRMFI